MHFGTWDILFNLVLLVFWLKIWMAGKRDTFFNPFLAPLDHGSDHVTSFLRPCFFGASATLIAAVLFVGLLLFRGVVLPRDAAWDLTLGVQRLAHPERVASTLAFSLVSFGIVLFKIWGASILLVRGRRQAMSDHTTSTFYYLARPFSDIRAEFRPLALLAWGVLLVSVMDRTGVVPIVIPPSSDALTATLDWHMQTNPLLPAKLCLLTVAGWFQILPLLRSFMLALIIGSWVSMFSTAPGLQYFCREWIDLLLGPFRRYPVRIGMIDLTPIIYFFALDWICRLVMPLLQAACNALS